MHLLRLLLLLPFIVFKWQTKEAKQKKMGDYRFFFPLAHSWEWDESCSLIHNILFAECAAAGHFYALEWDIEWDGREKKAKRNAKNQMNGFNCNFSHNLHAGYKFNSWQTTATLWKTRGKNNNRDDIMAIKCNGSLELSEPNANANKNALIIRFYLCYWRMIFFECGRSTNETEKKICRILK